VFTDSEKAKAYMGTLIDSARKEYEFWENEDVSEMSYSRFYEGYYPSDHFDIFITEQELDVPFVPQHIIEEMERVVSNFTTNEQTRKNIEEDLLSGKIKELPSTEMMQLCCQGFNLSCQALTLCEKYLNYLKEQKLIP
jgi:hypothetical protein